MSNLSVFSFEKSPVRTILVSGAPWFSSADVGKILQLSNIRASVALLDDDEKGVNTIDTPGGKQEISIVSESGLYALIFKSRRPEAKKFRRWVTSEVLPAIRKTGSYSAATLTPAEQLQIRKAISARAKKSAVAYQTIYHALYARFQVAKYDQIRSEDHQTALDFIATCEVKLPALPAPGIPKGAIILEKGTAESIRSFIYYWRYLFRPELEMVFRLLCLVKSPIAPRFWEAVTSMNLSVVEAALARQGYPVKDLSCYKFWDSHR